MIPVDMTAQRLTYVAKVECSWPESFPGVSYVREYKIRAFDDTNALEKAEDRASNDGGFNEGTPEMVVCLSVERRSRETVKGN